MFVTCYCDASFLPNQRASFAIWIKSKLGTRRYVGKCPAWIVSSQGAELYSIYVSIGMAFNLWHDVKRVLVCSDCLSALRIVKDVKLGKDKKYKRNDLVMLREKIILLSNKVEIFTKHVKGHDDLDGIVRNWFNNWHHEIVGKQHGE